MCSCCQDCTVQAVLGTVLRLPEPTRRWAHSPPGRPPYPFPAQPSYCPVLYMWCSRSRPSSPSTTPAGSPTIGMCGMWQTCSHLSQASRSRSGSAPVSQRPRFLWRGARAASFSRRQPRRHRDHRTSKSARKATTPVVRSVGRPSPTRRDAEAESWSRCRPVRARGILVSS